MDYPQVRKSSACPLCHEYKEVGAVVCWHCYRAHGLRYGNPEAEGLLAQAEAELHKRTEAQRL